ncbi:hypothetical protein HY416_01295 [Candidatus Kaiserbacteria bacterium]|nr:hypothetical protein [Candidatus Kaiserbacteria bacterium]
MDPQQHEQRLAQLEAKLDKIYESTEKTRKYFLAVIIVSVVLFVLPLLGLIFAIPTFLGALNTASELGI